MTTPVKVDTLYDGLSSTQLLKTIAETTNDTRKTLDNIKSNLNNSVIDKSNNTFYSEAANCIQLAKSITKQMAIEDRSSKTCIIFGLNEESSPTLINNLGLDKSSTISKISTDNN